MSTTQEALEAIIASAGATAQVPKRGPDVPVPGLGPDATWPDFWNYIIANSAQVQRDVEAQLGTDGAFISLEIQTYIASLLKVTSTYINNLYDTIVDTVTNVFEIGSINYQNIDARLTAIEQTTGNLVTSNYETREQIIPALFTQIAHLEQEMQQRDLIAAASLQQWALDNIYRPLQQQTELIEEDTRHRELVIAQQLQTETKQQVQQEEQERIAAFLLLQQSVRLLQTEEEECTKPMCETMGPKTDLGKFLKALSIASGAALFLELANLDEQGLENLIRGFQHLAGGAIDTFDDVFLGGGGTLLDFAKDVL